ncbi:MAG TPA: M50 family metallopeptidase [Azospirillum sp.]|nr:M50 family metallopeptidase [Azospirillum sp.]
MGVDLVDFTTGDALASFTVLITVIFTATVIHELGHGITARRFGLPVLSYEFGTGPLLRQFTVRGVPVLIRLFPMRAAVNLLGERRAHVIAPGQKSIRSAPMAEVLAAVRAGSVWQGAVSLAVLLASDGVAIVVGRHSPIHIPAVMFATFWTVSLALAVHNLAPWWAGLDGYIIRQLKRTQVHPFVEDMEPTIRAQTVTRAVAFSVIFAGFVMLNLSLVFWLTRPSVQ